MLSDEKFLASDDVMDWKNPAVLERAGALRSEAKNGEVFIRSAFEWVRDTIPHSWDHKKNPVACSASEVLAHQTGFCFAKAHLLTALLRSQGFPTGLCYQRMSVGREGKIFYLHGLCAVRLPKIGWYRMDPRGPKPGVDARFNPPQAALAYYPKTEVGERDYPGVYARALPSVVETLRSCKTWEDVARHLPDFGDAETLPVPFDENWDR